MTKVRATRAALVCYIGADGAPTTSQVAAGDVIDMAIPAGASPPDGFEATAKGSKPKPEQAVEAPPEVAVEEVSTLVVEVPVEETDERDGER